MLQGLGHDDMQEEYVRWRNPVTVIISRDGKICTKHTGMEHEESSRTDQALL